MNIVLVSDHGEESYEHGNWLHGTGLYAEVLEVPLLVKPPRGWTAAARRGGRSTSTCCRRSSTWRASNRRRLP